MRDRDAAGLPLWHPLDRKTLLECAAVVEMVCDGADINLNHEEYFTRIVEK
jgi:hypothetical protein